MTIFRSDLAPAPSPVAAIVDDMRLEAIVEACDLASSYARSASEAAWRGDRLTVGVHLQQLRLSTIEAIKVFKSLGAQADEEARGA
jgi:hypothetical protein